MARTHILTPETMLEIFGSFNTVARMRIPRRPLYPGCRRYVYLMEDVLDYLRKQTDGSDIEPDFL